MASWGWLADVNREPTGASRVCHSRRSSGGSRTGASLRRYWHAAIAIGSRGRRALARAVAVGQSDRANAVALRPLPGVLRLRLQTWVALATANGQARM